jgi:hypothetical protein
LTCAIPDVTAAPAAGPGRPIEALIGLLGAAHTPALAGLIRPDAHLAIGIFTAGDDTEAVGPMAEVLRAGLIRLKGDDPARVNIQVFVALAEGQPCLDPGSPAHAPALAAFVQRFAMGVSALRATATGPPASSRLSPGGSSRCSSTACPARWSTVTPRPRACSQNAFSRKPGPPPPARRRRPRCYPPAAAPPGKLPAGELCPTWHAPPAFASRFGGPAAPQTAPSSD